VSERIEREQELERYRTLTQTVSDVMVSIDTDSVIRDINPAVTDVFGYEPEAVIGESLTVLMPDRFVNDHFAAVIEDGRCHMTIQVPPGDGVRQVLDTVQEAYPDAEMVTRRQTTRDTGIDQNKMLELSETLTDRQLAVLRAAYHAGFFEWPRDASGEEVAESLDVAAPTFHQHLRKAEQKVFDLILSTIA
jgi:PAS domain-containing protein